MYANGLGDRTGSMPHAGPSRQPCPYSSRISMNRCLTTFAKTGPWNTFAYWHHSLNSAALRAAQLHECHQVFDPPAFIFISHQGSPDADHKAETPAYHTAMDHRFARAHRSRHRRAVWSVSRWPWYHMRAPSTRPRRAAYDAHNMRSCATACLQHVTEHAVSAKCTHGRCKLVRMSVTLQTM